MRFSCLVLSLSLLLTGCPEERTGLVVELRTDLVPGVEFVAIQTSLAETSLRTDQPATGDQDFYAGQRVADFTSIEPGSHLLDVRLLDATGAEVVSRSVRVSVDAPLAIVVLISRGCADVSCDPGSTCVRDTCIAVECHEELSPDSCNPPECEVDADCAPLSAACAESRCELGTCLAEPLSGACVAGEYCDVSSGCLEREMRDGGVGDAGVDAGACGPLPGLVGYWPMDSADVTGDRVADRSGNARDGRIIGAPAPVTGPGRVGEALDYAGTTTAHVDLPGLPLNSDVDGSTTVAMWFFREGPDVDEVLTYLPSTASASPPRYDLWLNTGSATDPALCINSGSSECWGIEDPGLLDRWVHVTAVFVNGPTINGVLYIDGVPVTMSCVFGTCDRSRVVEAPVTLAGPDSVYAFHGRMDEVRYFDRALSPEEVRTLYDCSL